MSMSHNIYGAPPPPPTSPLAPLGYPPPPPPRGPHHRWPRIAAAAALGAVVGAVATISITLQVRDDGARVEATPTATVTVSPPADPPALSPLPEAQANRETCGTRTQASRLISEASTAQGVIPQGMAIDDPAVQANPTWSAGVQRAAALYRDAGRTLKVTPGTTSVLAESVSTASRALLALGTTYEAFASVSGNTYDIASEASDTMDELCQRLAP